MSVRRRYSKSYPLQPRTIFSSQCWTGFGSGENPLVWFLEVTYSSAESLHPSSHKWVGSSVAGTWTSWGREPRTLRADSAEGAQCCFSALPAWVRGAHISLPDSLLPVILGAAGSFQSALSIPGSSLSLLTPPWAGQNWGRCGISEDLRRNQRQGSGDLDCQSWSPGGTFQKTAIGGIDSASPFVFRISGKSKNWKHFLNTFHPQWAATVYVSFVLQTEVCSPERTALWWY